eukprot:6581129-Prymnesium_polylepis.1
MPPGAYALSAALACHAVSIAAMRAFRRHCRRNRRRRARSRASAHRAKHPIHTGSIAAARQLRATSMAEWPSSSTPRGSAPLSQSSRTSASFALRTAMISGVVQPPAAGRSRQSRPTYRSRRSSAPIAPPAHAAPMTEY